MPDAVEYMPDAVEAYAECRTAKTTDFAGSGTRRRTKTVKKGGRGRKSMARMPCLIPRMPWKPMPDAVLCGSEAVEAYAECRT